MSKAVGSRERRTDTDGACGGGRSGDSFVDDSKGWDLSGGGVCAGAAQCE